MPYITRTEVKGDTITVDKYYSSRVKKKPADKAGNSVTHKQSK